MDRNEIFRKRMASWWERLVSYWLWMLIGVLIIVVYAFIFKDEIVFALNTVVETIYPTENALINWALVNPIWAMMIVALFYVLLFSLVALIEVQSITYINFLQGENKDKLEVLIHNQTGKELFECRVVLEDVYQNEKSIIQEQNLQILPGEDTLLWKDTEEDILDIYHEEMGTISLARYDEVNDLAFLHTSGGDVNLPQGVSKVRARLEFQKTRGRTRPIRFWVVIQFGEDELDIEGMEEIEE